jgi:hypothetical protein
MVGFDESEYEGMNDHWISSSLVPMKDALNSQADFVDFTE